MGNNRIVHFEIQTKDAQRTIKFYENIFNWEFKKWKKSERYWHIKTGDESECGINGGMMLKDELFPSVMNIIDIDDLEKTVKEIKSNGGEVVIEKLSLPKIGYLAYFRDPEGNSLGILQKDENAE